MKHTYNYVVFLLSPKTICRGGGRDLLQNLNLSKSLPLSYNISLNVQSYLNINTPSTLFAEL